MRWLMTTVAALFISVLPVVAAAQKVAGKTEGGEVTAPSVMLGQVVLGLVFVLAIIFLLAWILKRLGHGSAGHSRAMRVLAVLPLSTREKAVLIQVGEQQMLLGVAPGRVNNLHVFEEPVVTGGDKGTIPSGSEFASRFKEILHQRTGRR